MDHRTPLGSNIFIKTTWHFVLCSGIFDLQQLFKQSKIIIFSLVRDDYILFKRHYFRSSYLGLQHYCHSLLAPIKHLYLISNIDLFKFALLTFSKFLFHKLNMVFLYSNSFLKLTLLFLVKTWIYRET